MKIRFLIFCLFIICNLLYSQEIVVSEIFNASAPTDEWSELVVISDNVDLRNYTFGDNNATTSSWQTPITFNNISFWSSLRRGTIIVIRHRGTSSIDIDAADGFLDVAAEDVAYFSGGSFGSTLDLAAGGDYLRILNSGAHVHGLGYDNTPGTSWSGQSSSNKSLMHNEVITSGESVFVCPGANFADYFGNCSPNCYELGTSKTARSGTTSLGLPNSCTSSSTANSAFWSSLREPAITTQNYTQLVQPSPTIALTFTGAQDPINADNSQGYLVLSNTSNSFSNPVDGTSYIVGATLGTATVVSNTDNTVNSALMSINVNSITGVNYYKIFAYRYSADNINGNSFNAARGRAYNTSNPISITISSVIPLPLTLLNFTHKIRTENVQLEWNTENESLMQGFGIEQSTNAMDFNEIGFVKARNELVFNHKYSYNVSRNKQDCYYRLKMIEKDQTFSYSSLLFVSKTLSEEYIKIYPNPFQDKLTLDLSEFEFLNLVIVDINGKEIFRQLFTEYIPEIELNTSIEKGIYFLQIQTEKLNRVSKISSIDY